jgi:hypothetical protein
MKIRRGASDAQPRIVPCPAGRTVVTKPVSPMKNIVKSSDPKTRRVVNNITGESDKIISITIEGDFNGPAKVHKEQLDGRNKVLDSQGK